MNKMQHKNHTYRAPGCFSAISGLHGFNDKTYYNEAEVSSTGIHFTDTGLIVKVNWNKSVRLFYQTSNGKHIYYSLKIRGISPGKYVRYSNINRLFMKKCGSSKFSLNSNPFISIVGIKFDDISAGRFVTLIDNTLKQIVVTKRIEMAGYFYSYGTT
jgi:hypothetical protein